MIISASRRTDIPAFYAKWFINRVQEGYCTVPNPIDHSRIARISLNPKDVEAIVFWTRSPAPLMPYLDELDSRGFRYYFQYTLLKNPRELDEKGPDFAQSINTFQQLAEKIGPERVIWRYDPIVFTEQTGMSFHLEAYKEIAGKLKGFTHRSVISIMDFYQKFQKRIKKLEKQGITIYDVQDPPGDRFAALMQALVKSANENGMEIVSCAEELELSTYGIKPGKCVDDEYIEKILGVEVTHKKDPGQRKACGCVVSRDIGMYDSCPFGCQYCYATSNFERARLNHSQHDPKSPSLLGWYEAQSDAQDPQTNIFP